MILLKLKAGLGNQLFEYAHARSVALRNKTNLKLDISWYSSISSKDTVREYRLDPYNIKAELASEEDLARFKAHNGRFRSLFRKVANKIGREIFGKSDYVYYPRLARLPDGSFIEGHQNSEKYFKEFEKEIRQELTLKVPLGDKAKETEQKLKSYAAAGETLVLVHVRRGDYVSNQFASIHHGTKGVDYYRVAIDKMLEILESRESNRAHSAGPHGKIRFMLASDDMAWTMDNIGPLILNAKEQTGFECVIEPLSDQAAIKDYEEIHLMSLCHHFIIANSSFSWWGAWLSETARLSGSAASNTNNEPRENQKIVIGPKAWVNDPSIDTRDALPEEWIRI